jgi:sulfite exporter TauE/SafE
VILQALIAGLVLGSVSSLHCVGMCGPIALALPVKHLSNQSQKFAVLLYNAGRVAGYSALGLVLGLLGHQFYIAGFQQWFSILAGLLILFFVIQFYILKKNWQPGWLQKIHHLVQRLMVLQLSKKTIGSYFLLGAVNSILPCGVVYVALASALSFSIVSLSVLFMAGFGLGTLPLMVVLGLFGNTIKPVLRMKMRNAIPYLISIMAVLLILRGLNMGIPFISPMLTNASAEAVLCH